MIGGTWYQSSEAMWCLGGSRIIHSITIMFEVPHELKIRKLEYHNLLTASWLEEWFALRLTLRWHRGHLIMRKSLELSPPADCESKLVINSSLWKLRSSLCIPNVLSLRGWGCSITGLWWNSSKRPILDCIICDSFIVKEIFFLLSCGSWINKSSFPWVVN